MIVGYSGICMVVSGTPLLVIQPAEMHQTEKLERKNITHTHTETVSSLQTVCIFPNPYLLSLHLASSSMLTFSPTSLQLQLAARYNGLGRCSPDTTPAGG